MVMVALSTFITLGILFGAVFGSFESEEVLYRSSIGSKKKLPHAWLLVVRLSICSVFALMGTEIVEGAVEAGQITISRRLDLTDTPPIDPAQ